MIREWIRGFLGIKEIERRISSLEEEKAGLEEKVIVAQQEKNAIARTIQEGTFNNAIANNTLSLLVNLKDPIVYDNRFTSTLKAIDVVERYGLSRYSFEKHNHLPKNVISLKQFQLHPEEYLFKISKGFFQFPLGLNFKNVNEYVLKKFTHLSIDPASPYATTGTLSFILSSLLGAPITPPTIDEITVQAMELSHLQRNSMKDWIHIETLDFLSNCGNLQSYIRDLGDVEEKYKERAISGLEAARFVYLTAFEIIGKTRIRDLTELLEFTNNEPANLRPKEMSDTLENLKHSITIALLRDPIGTSDREIEKLLPLRSRQNFRLLASKLTTKIIASDQERCGLTRTLNKKITEYSIGESIVLACYFARNVITQYKNLEDSVNAIFSGSQSSALSGKCTDYAGLALHYLREYLIPLHPEKFVNWKFGVENDHIGDYRHCYIQAIHYNADLTVDVYFLDPTSLASHGIEELTTAKSIVNATNSASLPLLIERDAEDLLYTALKNKPPF